jgi:nucleoid-associated protein EbfC
MNLQALMKQAQSLQKDMLKAKEEVEKTVFEEKNSNLLLKANGKKELLEIKFADNFNITEVDEDFLQDILLVGLNSLFKRIDDETEKKLGKFANSLPGLF